MIRKPSGNENVTVNVILKNGEEYLGKDTPENPFGDDSMPVVSFWDNDKVVIYPMSEIKKIEMVFS